MMNRFILLLLLLLLLPPLLGAAPAFADQTIDQLSLGAALGGSEAIPMVQGADPAVKATPRAIATYIPTLFNSVDATQYAGADMCAQISAAGIAAAKKWPGGATIDARGFSGTQHCTGNMFASWPGQPFNGVVIFGNALLLTDASISIPSGQGLMGTMAYNDDQAPNAGFVIQASDSFPINTPLIATAPIPTTVAAFGTTINHMAVKCYRPTAGTPAGSTGIQNFYSQEETTMDHIIIRGCVDGLVIAGQIGDGSAYSHIYVSDVPGISAANWHCLRVGDPSYPTQDNGAMDINYFECNTYGSGAVMANKIMLDGHQYSLRHVYMENSGSAGATNFINIGGQSGAAGAFGITVEDVTCDGTVGPSAGSNCILLSSGANYGTFNVLNVQAPPGGTVNIINDAIAPGNGCTIVSGYGVGQEVYLGFYSRGTGGRIVNTSSACPKP
jgi:hypothetical protein